MTIVNHGAYGTESKYEITKHDYAGGGHPGCGGYVELLEIKGSLDNHCLTVIHEWLSHKGSIFAEWKTLEDAKVFFEKNWRRNGKESLFPLARGFLRLVVCGDRVPWFYAKDNEMIIGDFVVPVGYLF